MSVPHVARRVLPQTCAFRQLPPISAQSSRLSRQRQTPQCVRTLTTTQTVCAVGGPPRSYSRPPPRNSKLLNRDRGPRSEEDTQTDFGALNVLGNTPNPSTSVDICITDGFVLDSGLRVEDGDGVILTSSEAFVWRPWMSSSTVAEAGTGGVVHGLSFRHKGRKQSDVELTGGVVNKLGQFEIPEAGWGLFKLLWPKPDLLIIGTGPTIRPLAPSTRSFLQTLGMRIEVLDTRNAASQFNLLATERGVNEIAAALVPIGFGER